MIHCMKYNLPEQEVHGSFGAVVFLFVSTGAFEGRRRKGGAACTVWSRKLESTVVCYIITFYLHSLCKVCTFHLLLFIIQSPLNVITLL